MYTYSDPSPQNTPIQPQLGPNHVEFPILPYILPPRLTSPDTCQRPNSNA